MTQGERVKEIRKALGLTLEKFGERLGIGKSAVSKIERGENSATEQVMKSICREFSVDYIWLTTGEGKMFMESDADFLEKIDRIMAGENDMRRNMIKALLNASDRDIECLNNLIESYVSLRKSDEKERD